MNRSKYNKKGEGGIKRSEKREAFFMDGFVWLKIRKMYLNIYIKVSDNYHWYIWHLPFSRHQPSQTVWQKNSGCYWWKTVNFLSTYSKAYRWHYKKAMLPKVTVHKAKFKKAWRAYSIFKYIHEAEGPW